jgi:hypothetical protein
LQLEFRAPRAGWELLWAPYRERRERVGALLYAMRRLARVMRLVPAEWQREKALDQGEREFAANV